MAQDYSIASLKKGLDLWLATAPDQQRIGHLTPGVVDRVTGWQSNSLLAWVGTTID